MKTFEAFFKSGDYYVAYNEIIDILDDFFDKTVDKIIRVPILKQMEKVVIERVYPRLLQRNNKLRLENIELKEKNKKLGLELQNLMNNRRLEKRKIEVLEKDILF
jgi:hypothetical protein